MLIYLQNISNMNPVQSFIGVAIVSKVCLSNLVKKAKEISYLIFGLLKLTKTL